MQKISELLNNNTASLAALGQSDDGPTLVEDVELSSAIGGLEMAELD